MLAIIFKGIDEAIFLVSVSKEELLKIINRYEGNSFRIDRNALFDKGTES